MTSYQAFSDIYDRAMDHDYYDYWADYTEKYLKTSEQALDLGCGTGEIAMRLLAQGYQITGLDLSQDMLDIAKEKAEQVSIDFPVVQADMRTFELDQKFDLIFSYSDTMCYLADPKDFQQCLNQVYKHLNEGGTFLFDVHSLYQINEVFPGYAFNMTWPDAAFLWYSIQGEENTIDHELTFFKKEEDSDNYVRYEESHHERTYEIEEIYDMCLKAGFSEMELTANFGEDSIDDETERWFFRCQK